MNATSFETSLEQIDRLARTVGRSEVTVGNLAANLRRLIKAVESGDPATVSSAIAAANVHLSLADQFIADTAR